MPLGPVRRLPGHLVPLTIGNGPAQRSQGTGLGLASGHNPVFPGPPGLHRFGPGL
jgi:hypothetical protein